MIVTVALLRAALTSLAAYNWRDPLPVMVSSPVNVWARPLASAIRFGHFKTIKSDDHVGPVGRLTRNPSDGPLVAALTVAEPDRDPTAEDIAKAITDVQLANNLFCAELLDPNLPVVIPTDRNEYELYSPLDPVMNDCRYDPDGEQHHGVWGHDDGPTAHVLWPIPPRRAATPPTPIRPVDWLARLHQTETWTDWHGYTHRLRDMEIYANCMARAWLEINAAVITKGVIRHILGHPDTAIDADPGRLTPLQEADIAVTDPHGWIAETPLVQALADVYAN
ncbi:hypothetical protein ACFOY2_46245 [Nonomuraea purpurea]|uniref:Uncharacterized protein n=1 Tax=Nonomuraea purpurea TaxID=1849276 RepID=A0ABV8GP50_9ACTN